MRGVPGIRWVDKAAYISQVISEISLIYPSNTEGRATGKCLQMRKRLRTTWNYINLER